MAPRQLIAGQLTARQLTPDNWPNANWSLDKLTDKTIDRIFKSKRCKKSIFNEMEQYVEKTWISPMNQSVWRVHPIWTYISSFIISKKNKPWLRSNGEKKFQGSRLSNGKNTWTVKKNLKNLVIRYEDTARLDFLRGIAHNITY